MARRKQDSLIREAIESPLGAIALAVLGWMAWGPLPEFFVKSFFGPAEIDSSNGASVLPAAFASAFLQFNPVAETIGLLLMTVAIFCLAFHWHKGMIKHPKVTNKQGALAISLLGLCLLAVTANSYEEARNPKQATSQVASVASTTAQPDAASLPAEFPESGTTIWGSQGQPITGNLSTMSIWDVSGSDQNKVIRIRRHIPAYNRGANTSEPVATVFLVAGERKDLRLKPGLYDVVVGSSEGWNEQGFAGAVSIASFGTINAAAPGAPAILAIGAPDQEASLVDASWF